MVFSCLSHFKPSWTRLFNEFAIRQKSIFEVCGTKILSNWEVVQRADGDDRSVYDQLDQRMWRASSLLCDGAVRTMNSKTFVLPTLCFAREASVQNQFKLGKTNLTGIWKLVVSMNWIELWRTDGIRGEKFSRIHYSWNSQWDSKDDGVNLSNFKEGSSSCPCSMTLYGELQEMKNNCIANFVKVATCFQKGFHQDAGHFWDLFVRESGLALTSASQIVNETELLKSWRSTSPKTVIIFQATSPLGSGALKSKGGGENHSPQMRWRKRWIVPSHLIFVNQLSIYRAVAELCDELDLWVFGDTDWECPHVTISTGKLVARLFQEMSKLCKDAGFLKNIEKGQDVTALISFIVQRPDRFVSSHFEWFQQIRHRNIRGNTQWEYWLVHQHRETCGKDLTKAKFCCEFKCQCSHSWKKMDRHWSTTVRSLLFWSAKIHDQNNATWLLNSSTRRRSSKTWRSDREIKRRI